jgi:hypothetical protein
VDREIDQKPDKKTWKAPVLRKVDLTQDELVQLRASEDPMALLLKIKPDIKLGG